MKMSKYVGIVVFTDCLDGKCYSTVVLLIREAKKLEMVVMVGDWTRLTKEMKGFCKYA